ncbi:MAG: transposase [Planctomycetota bacterium]
MANTMGYHIVLAGYGLWLPGDSRGSWSTAWDEQIGFHHPHRLNPGDPVRQRMARERMKHPPARLTSAMSQQVITTIGKCEASSSWRIVAASVEPSHTHLLVTYSERAIDNTVKWIKDRCTKAIHLHTDHSGPVWCEGRWRSYIFDDMTWTNTTDYIRRHNLRRGEPADPYPWITP